MAQIVLPKRLGGVLGHSVVHRHAASEPLPSSTAKRIATESTHPMSRYRAPKSNRDLALPLRVAADSLRVLPANLGSLPITVTDQFDDEPGEQDLENLLVQTFDEDVGLLHRDRYSYTCGYSWF